MKNYMKKLISYLYYRYCFKSSYLASHIVCYYVPFVLESGVPLSGSYFFGIINEKIKEGENELWNPPFGSNINDSLNPLVSIHLNDETVQ